MSNLSDQITKALAFDLTKWEREYKIRGVGMAIQYGANGGASVENQRLAPIHEKLIACVEVLEVSIDVIRSVKQTSDIGSEKHLWCEESLPVIDKALNELREVVKNVE